MKNWEVLLWGIVLLLAVAITGCTRQLYTPTISELQANAALMQNVKLPTNDGVWVYTEYLMANFMKRADLDAGIDLGGNILDAGLSAAAVGMAIGTKGTSTVAYLAGAEGLLRRLLGIANPIVRGNALSGGVRALRACRSQFLVDLSAESATGRVPANAGSRLTPAGIRFFQCDEAAINIVIGQLQGAWPTLPDMIQATPAVLGPTPTGDMKIQPLQKFIPKIDGGS